MSLPNKDELKKQQAAASGNASSAAAAATHKAEVDRLTKEIETAVKGGNWNPITRGYLQPVIDEVIAKAVQSVFDLRPGAIIRTLGLDQPIFTKTTNYGHFTKGDLPWERLSRMEMLDEACEIIEEELFYLRKEGVLK